MKTRRRSAVLHALDVLRRDSETLTVKQLVLFLYAAENEGATLTELAAVAGFSLATASRASRAMAGRGKWNSLPPYADLLDVRTNPANANGRVVALSARGRGLVDRIDRIIAKAEPIRRLEAG